MRRVEAAFFAAALALAAPARADLYRWIDPQTGSVKLSTLPPSDAAIKAELVPYTGPVPVKAPAPPSTAKSPSPPLAFTPVTQLQAQLNALFSQLMGTTPNDFTRAGDAIRQQLETYEAVRAELDRVDPAGAARRAADSTSLLERLRQGLAAQLSPTAPVQK